MERKGKHLQKGGCQRYSGKLLPGVKKAGVGDISKCLGFKILQFNAVVETNIHARHLYERIGFTGLGVIPNGFRMKDGHYENICPYYIEL